VLQLLGRGGMATVFKGYHARLDRPVAIKAIHQAYTRDENFLTRFEREARIVARLDHPNIVPIYDYAEHEGQPYLVIKYIEGQTLKEVIAAEPPPLERIVDLMSTVAAALDYAHSQGVLHRDLKPSNILIDNNGVAYLTDFGLARMVGASESTMSRDMVLGTPQYVSPEQAMGDRELTPQSDLYSLGVILYELVVGRPPFTGDTPYAIIHDQIYSELPRPSDLNPDVPPQVEAVLEKALAKDPAQRYASAAELMDAFRNAIAEAGLTTLNPDRRQIANARATEYVPVGSRPASAPVVPSAKPKRRDNVEFRLDLGQIGEQIRSTFENWEDSPLNPSRLNNEPVPIDEASIRKRIEKQHNKRKEFITHLVVYGFINLMLWLIFIFTSGESTELGLPDFAASFPWPLIVSFGWGSGLVAHAIDTWAQTGSRVARLDRAVRNAMRAEYGEDWLNVASKAQYNKVQRRVEKPFKKRIEFIQHAAVYLCINLMLWAMFVFTTGASAELGLPDFAAAFPWPLIVGLGWGAGLVAHAADTFMHGGFSAEAYERKLQQEVERELQSLAEEEGLYEKPKRDRGIRLTEDGELTDSIAEAWDLDAGKAKRSRR